MVGFLGILALVATTSGGGFEAPDRIVTKHRLDLVIDERVFAFFSVLNALGYAHESERKGPPLDASVFHPVRAKVRDGLRVLESEGKLQDLRRLFEEHPAPVEQYLVRLLDDDGKAAKDGGAAKTPAALLVRLLSEPSFAKVRDEVLLDVHVAALALAHETDRALDAAETQLQVKIVAPENLVVVPNFLESHARTRLVRVGTKDVLVVGAGTRPATRAAVRAVLLPQVRGWVSRAWGQATKLRQHWDTLKTSRRIRARWPDGESYAAETIARILAFDAIGQGKEGNAEVAKDDFIERETKAGLRWTRALLSALETRGKERIDLALPKVLARANP